MKIRCINEKDGCKEILSLDHLDNHEKSCRCDKCFRMLTVDHNCIQSLLDSEKKLIQSNEALKGELKRAMDKISSMYLEIEDYSQTIEQLKKANGKNLMPSAPKQVQIN